MVPPAHKNHDNNTNYCILNNVAAIGMDYEVFGDIIILIIVIAAVVIANFAYDGIKTFLKAYEIASTNNCSNIKIGIVANVCVKLYVNGSVDIVEIGR